MGAAAVARLTEAVAVAAVGAASARVLRKSGGRNMSLPKLSTNRYGVQRRFVIVHFDKVLII